MGPEPEADVHGEYDGNWVESFRRCLPQNLLDEYPFTADDALALQLDLFSLPPFIREGGRGDGGREFVKGDVDPDWPPGSP